MTRIVVMGVSGCGKTTIGSLLAQQLDLAFADGDTFHSAANVAKMHAGIPLDDNDRATWLAAMAEWLRGHNDGCVLACSALKVAHRDVFRNATPDVFFAHLVISERVDKERVANRVGHFMPASLVHSQFETIEPLQPGENGVDFDAQLEPQLLVDSIVNEISQK